VTPAGPRRAALAPSAEAVPYSRIREIAEMAMRMEADVLRLYFGESSLPTPQFVKDAAVRALDEGWTFYTANAGLPTLREALAAYYERFHGVGLDPAEIVITASGVQALNVAIRAVLDPGDEGVVLTPAWPNGAANVLLCNATAIEVPHVLAGDRYTIDLDAVEAAITERTRLLLYTSPSNPLGWVATEDDQRALLELARRHGLWLLADEVYERLYHRGVEPGVPCPSILRLATRDDAVIVCQSFSKTYCMTGWRVGWLVGRRDLATKAAELNEYVVSHAPSFTQRACEVALRDGEEELRAMVAQLRANRDLCLEALRAMPGVTVPDPEGAFYLFPRVEGLDDSFAFCKRLLVEHHVGIAPGVAFGLGGEGSVRICYASEPGILEAALERLDRFLRDGVRY
jgi:aspartate/methionine/tyrosine aminotransferase